MHVNAVSQSVVRHTDIYTQNMGCPSQDKFNGSICVCTANISALANTQSSTAVLRCIVAGGEVRSESGNQTYKVAWAFGEWKGGTGDFADHLVCCFPPPQHSSVDGFAEPSAPPTKSASRHSLPRCRNSFTSTEEHPHIGNYRLLKTIGKGNFAKVKLARHVLTGREVRILFRQ